MVAVTLPCSAQTILKSEPLALAPYEVAFVQDISCPAGKVLKVALDAVGGRGGGNARLAQGKLPRADTADAAVAAARTAVEADLA